MALLFFDGFERYYRGDDMSVITSDVISSISMYGNNNFRSNGYIGRRGGYCWCQQYGDNYIKYVLSSNYQTFIFGAAFKLDALPSYSQLYPFLSFRDGLSDAQLRFHGNGSEILVYRGDNTQLGTTSGAGLAMGVWRYLEIKVTIDNSSGAVEIRIDGSTVLNLTSQDTQYTSNAYFNVLDHRMMYTGALNYTYWDDMYWLDTTGTKNNDFLGDVRVDPLDPSGAGTYTDFTPSAGSNYQNVDEIYPDDDTTYNDGANVADQDTYAMDDLEALSTTIHGVKSQITVRKTDAGSRGTKILTRSGTTDHLSSELALSDSFVTHLEIMEDNPDDSAAWAEADVNAMEVGIEITT